MTREEAIERIKYCIEKQAWALDENDTEALYEVIPELRESERIRNEIEQTLAMFVADKDSSLHPGAHYTVNEAIAWLEKQKEQKPEWGVEDKRKLNRIYAILGQAADTHAFSTTCRLIGDKEAVELQDFLRSIAKPKSYDWSEEDERIVQTMIKEADLKPSEMHWLKSLKNRGNSPESNTNSPWKPSEEQMEALKDAVKLYKETHFENFHQRIESLYEQLKKMM